MCPKPGVEVEALKKIGSLTPADAGENVKLGLGGVAAGGAPTGVDTLLDADSPRSLVTVSVTTNVCWDVNVCVTERPEPVAVPSPKFQEYAVICVAPVPGKLAEPSNVTWEFCTATSGDMVNDAVGVPAGGRITPGGTSRMVTSWLFTV